MKDRALHTVCAAALLLALLFSLNACALRPEDKIIGTWMDSASTQGYIFQEEGRVRVIYYNFSASEGGLFSYLKNLTGIGSSLLDGAYDGSYTMDTENETVTITYTLFGSTRTAVYQYAFTNNDLVLTEQGGGKSTTFFLQNSAESSTGV